MKPTLDTTTRCPICNQVGGDPGGEYPCPACGRPTLHDDELPNTDEKLNHAVALARGYTHQGHSDEFGEMWASPDGHSAFLPDVCSDPAAWGDLLQWLATQPYGAPSLGAGFEGNPWRAHVGWSHADADTPGRALAEAFLKARSRKVTDF